MTGLCPFPAHPDMPFALHQLSKSWCPREGSCDLNVKDAENLRIKKETKILQELDISNRRNTDY